MNASVQIYRQDMNYRKICSKSCTSCQTDTCFATFSQLLHPFTISNQYNFAKVYIPFYMVIACFFLFQLLIKYKINGICPRIELKISFFFSFFNMNDSYLRPSNYFFMMFIQNLNVNCRDTGANHSSKFVVNKVPGMFCLQ